MPSSAEVLPAPSPPGRRAEPVPDSLIHEFVWRGHFDPEGVRRMLDQTPPLLNGAYDWGNGDFETAIGAAAHMGRRDIAEFLLSRGARADLFVSAMLGHATVVSGMITATPLLVNSQGPHALLRHAVAGGDAAKPVADYLRSILATKVR